MPVTKFLLIFILLFSPLAQAREQNWGIFQFVKKEDSNIYMAEWLRRDRGALFDEHFFDYFRFSVGKKYGDFVFLIGGGYVDFESSPDEKRLHQFVVYQKTLPNFLFTRNRFGFEERFFNGDSEVYLRIRLRNQVNLLPQFPWGLAAFNEIFVVPWGHGRFHAGLNENRFGVGPRYTEGPIELYLYYMQNFIRTPARKSHPVWGMLQIQYSF